jgi:hypothetical protein
MTADPRLVPAVILTLALSIACRQSAAQAAHSTSPTRPVPGRTRLIVLGVSHSGQLVSSSYQPAVFRAFFDRVKPAAICIERDPDDYARHDFYEFTYEQQNIVVPWTANAHVPVFPVDWLPSPDDQLLVWNTPDISAPPFLRNPSGFGGFITFDDSSDLKQDLFFAEAPAMRETASSWVDSKRAQGRQDFPRRLELYRTFMQAMRIRNVVERFPGQTILVVIGQMHKDDIERILASEPNLDIVQPSSIGAPTPAEIEKEITDPDLFAIASFNLLGVQSLSKNEDWSWIATVLSRLERDAPGSETDLLRARFDVLRGSARPQQAIAEYDRLLNRTEPKKGFTYTGVTDHRRVDSFFDPFGNLTISQRLLLELARENFKLHNTEGSTSAKNRLLHSGLSAMQKAQLEGYWQRYVEQMP